MAAGEVLANSKFYLEFDGITALIVKKISGLSIKLEAAGDMKSYGVRKEATSFMQATVSGVTSGTISVEFVATVEDHSMHDWYRESHSIGGPMAGKGSASGGARKSAFLTVYNQQGKPAARWNFTGVFPKSYKTSKMEPGGTELFTEKMEFVYETCHRVPAGDV
ncbi:phage tail protein [Trichocoleus sp. FACHB-262]|uniref:phage tail protein n=1 Tax=Trichocoleus sp. FACHB-262 TaxID=2692869 RepID=UPI001685844B|nr:phage tail protein [Trichocoleus sp. FACHB-262]MBD2123525.1 phage tail protein [Trichocoleus sp. FACHB-262]